MALLQELVALEECLLRLGSACDRQHAELLLAIEFVEFGASGRVWTRGDILDELDRTPERVYEISGIGLQILSDASALLTYHLLVAGKRSLRSSLWIKRHDRWQMLFRQGTVVEV
jgi:hypothetical protein